MDSDDTKPRLRSVAAKGGTADREPTGHETVDHESADHETADHETADHETADHETADHETADHETADHETADHETKGRRLRRRGIYLLPNLITTAALFAGFYAIVAAMNGRYIPAAFAIFVAMALDTADGRVARLTRTESAFGAEYDSLSDMVAFGVAPGLVAFAWGLSTLGQIGWVVTFIYMACAALRLARFNTKRDNASFTGLASPSAAAIIACSIWAWAEYGGGEPSTVAAGIMAAVTALAGLLMVSNFTYFSPKNINFKGRIPFVTLVLIVIGFAVLLADPPTVLLFLFTVYALSGPARHAWSKIVHGRNYGDDDTSNPNS